jgi:hypothetical protein
LVLLYFWLIGHWYARVLMSIVLIPVAWLVVAFVLQGVLAMGHPGAAVVWVVITVPALAIAWFTGKLPMLYWQANARKLAAAGMHSALRQG